jgi:hypothetical protein
MPNTPLVTFAHFLGRPKKSAKSTGTETPKRQPGDTIPRKLPPAAGHFAECVARKAVRTVAVKAKTTPKVAPRKPASRSFAHLAPASFQIEDDFLPPSSAAATAIVAAAAKGRSVVPVAKPEKNSVAAAILAAGRRARMQTTGPEPTGLAARIIAAGKRRRGEPK